MAAAILGAILQLHVLGVLSTEVIWTLGAIGVVQLLACRQRCW